MGNAELKMKTQAERKDKPDKSKEAKGAKEVIKNGLPSCFSKHLFVFDEYVTGQSYFLDLTKAIYSGGGFCFQDSRFFSKLQLLEYCDKVVYCGRKYRKKH